MNKELALRVLNKIKENPNNWKQWMWAIQEPCGTSHCFAGHTVHLSFPDAKPYFQGTRKQTSQYILNGVVDDYKFSAKKLLDLTMLETV